MCISCCAMALFTLQTNSPSGGQGNRTSLRGGGPLTTIVLGDTLWQTIWLNVLTESDFFGNFDKTSKVTYNDIFPWMGSTRTSEKGEVTTPEDVNIFQIFWGMPRRIVLDLDHSNDGICDICGCKGSMVHEYMSKNYGTNYKGAWHHILTPYSKNKSGDKLPRHGNPGGITFRHWLGLVQNDDDYGEPSSVVHKFLERQSLWFDLHNILRNNPQLWAFGYDFDNMKARCWYEGKMPLIHIEDTIRKEYERIIFQLIKAAEIVNKNVRISIKEAMFRRPGDKSGDFSFIDNRFWNDTEREFYLTLDNLRTSLLKGADPLELKRSWLKIISDTGMRLFDEMSQSNQIELADPKRIALARNKLRNFNSEYNKQIRTCLDLPVLKSNNSR